MVYFVGLLCDRAQGAQLLTHMYLTYIVRPSQSAVKHLTHQQYHQTIEYEIAGSDWEGELGYCDFEGINVRVPWSLARLSQRLDPRTLDLSGMGPGIDVSEQRMQPDQDDDTNPVGVNGVKLVKGISLNVFRRKLVNHFKILFARNEIKWPTRRPINQMPHT